MSDTKKPHLILTGTKGFGETHAMQSMQSIFKERMPGEIHPSDVSDTERNDALQMLEGLGSQISQHDKEEIMRMWDEQRSRRVTLPPVEESNNLLDHKYIPDKPDIFDPRKQQMLSDDGIWILQMEIHDSPEIIQRYVIVREKGNNLIVGRIYPKTDGHYEFEVMENTMIPLPENTAQFIQQNTHRDRENEIPRDIHSYAIALNNYVLKKMNLYEEEPIDGAVDYTDPVVLLEENEEEKEQPTKPYVKPYEFFKGATADDASIVDVMYIVYQKYKSLSESVSKKTISGLLDFLGEDED